MLLPALDTTNNFKPISDGRVNSFNEEFLNTTNSSSLENLNETLTIKKRSLGMDFDFLSKLNNLELSDLSSIGNNSNINISDFFRKNYENLPIFQNEPRSNAFKIIL